MVILTCANINIAKDKYSDEYGKWYRNFSFIKVIQETVKKAEESGYKTVVYDLGELGIGEKYLVADKTFAEKGYYEVQVQEGYKSRSLFKPEIVKHCIIQNNDFTVYLDGDAQLMDKLDEIQTDDYDIGVTLRKASELEEEWHKNHFEIAKYLNAGVIFFNTTPASMEFIDAWEKKTQEVGNDQKALNQLACPEHYPQAYSIVNIKGFRIKYFPCEKYNYYYFDEGLYPNIKIIHFKGIYREYFPFDFKKRFYCKFIIPIRNKLGFLIKKILKKRPDK
jgi:hypothetical protein